MKTYPLTSYYACRFLLYNGKKKSQWFWKTHLVKGALPEGTTTKDGATLTAKGIQA